MTDDTLEKIEKLKGLLSHVDPEMSLGELIDRLCDMGLKELDPARKELKRKTVTPRIAISEAEFRGRIWKRDKSQRTNCGATHFLEIDHVIPRAKGGLDTLENQRLLCRACNQRAAIEDFGLNKMDRYLKREKRETC